MVEVILKYELRTIPMFGITGCAARIGGDQLKPEPAKLCNPAVKHRWRFTGPSHDVN